MPDRGQLLFRLSGASDSSRPLEQVALVPGSYIHRWRPSRSRYLLRILNKRISPRERFQYRLRHLHSIVPCSRHGVGKFWSSEIGMPLVRWAKACRCVRGPLVTAHRSPLLTPIADSDVSHRNLSVALAYADPAGLPELLPKSPFEMACVFALFGKLQRVSVFLLKAETLAL